MNQSQRMKIFLIIGCLFFILALQYELWFNPLPAEAGQVAIEKRKVGVWLMTFLLSLGVLAGFRLDSSENLDPLSIASRIRRGHSVYEILNPLLYSMLTLGFYGKRTVLNLVTKEMIISTRIFWVLSFKKKYKLRKYAGIKITHNKFYINWDAYHINLVTRSRKLVEIGVVRGPKWFPMSVQGTQEIMKGYQEEQAIMIASSVSEILELPIL